MTCPTDIAAAAASAIEWRPVVGAAVGPLFGFDKYALPRTFEAAAVNSEASFTRVVLIKLSINTPHVYAAMATSDSETESDNELHDMHQAMVVNKGLHSQGVTHVDVDASFPRHFVSNFVEQEKEEQQEELEEGV